jgi:hypothetical protein
MGRRLLAAAFVCSFVLVSTLSSSSLAQRRGPALVCKRPVLAALKPAPQLTYPCDEQLQEWDEKILKLPARVEAIQKLMAELATFSEPAWWAADAVDLSVCDFAKRVGPLTSEQRRDFLNSEYLFWLFGNDPMRLVLVSDPCYQTQYGGSNAFLLYRDRAGAARDHVVVSQVLDGYFSRADNSVGLAVAKLGNEDIVEISTGSGGLNPSLTNYYFAIDPRSKHAEPKKLFISDHGPTNEISSAMLMESAGPDPLKIVRGAVLAKTFNIYFDDEHGRIQDSGRTLSRKILRWNGKTYR